MWFDIYIGKSVIIKTFQENFLNQHAMENNYSWHACFTSFIYQSFSATDCIFNQLNFVNRSDSTFTFYSLPLFDFIINRDCLSDQTHLFYINCDTSYYNLKLIMLDDCFLNSHPLFVHIRRMWGQQRNLVPNGTWNCNLLTLYLVSTTGSLLFLIISISHLNIFHFSSIWKCIVQQF